MLRVARVFECPLRNGDGNEIAVALLLAIVLNGSALATGVPSLAGNWSLKADKSKGVGMMGSVAITTVITQTGSVLKVHEITLSQGNEQTLDHTYDAAGEPKTNESPMGDKSSTVADAPPAYGTGAWRIDVG